MPSSPCPFFCSLFSVFRVSKEDFTGKEEEEEEQGAVNFVSFFSLSLCKVPAGQKWGEGGEGRCFFGSKFTRKKQENFKKISNFIASLPKVYDGIFASEMANPAPDKQFAAKEEADEEIERENSNSGPRFHEFSFFSRGSTKKLFFLFLSKTKKGERKLEMRKWREMQNF